MSWIESTTNIINIGLALLILYLGLRILKSMRFSLQRGSVRLFIAAAILFAAKEILSSVERGFRVYWIHDIHEVFETGFIGCLCCAMYLIVQSEKIEIGNLHRQGEMVLLTGLMKFSAFSRLNSQRIEHARENGLPLALFIVDVDAFEQYKDSFGQEAERFALQSVAKALSKATRENDLIGHCGAHEFILLLYIDHAAHGAAERIRLAIETDCSPQNNAALQRPLTVSIGVSRLNSSLPSLKAMIEQADRELYQAKHAGRNRVSVAQDG